MSIAVLLVLTVLLGPLSSRGQVNTVGAAGPTSTPTSTVVPATATPIATATVTATPAPFTYSALFAKIGYGSSKAEKVYSRPSLARVHAGKEATLYLYMTFLNITSKMPVRLSFRVTSGSKTVFVDKWSDSISPSDNDGWTSFSDLYTPKKTGKFRFSGTIFIGSKHQHKTVAFAVIR